MKTLSLSITQFNTFVKNILDAEEFLSNISVFGEVTNFKMSGGNAWFDLKDENAMLSCVKFGASDLNIKNGDLITVYGKVNFYVKSGRLNFIAGRVEAYGLGDLYQRFLMLKEKLEKEGLFREDIKKPIPTFAKNIGVVTSETGAVIRDIIHVTRSKNPFTNIIVYPSKVQGVGAELEIVKGVEYFNSRGDIDTIIVARGGGSLEDLAPFNTEAVVRGIYKSNIPVISAVGHETDFTLCDFASDLRVPTPSVAAEIAVFDYYEQVNNILQINKNNYYYITKILKSCKDELVNISSSICDKQKLKIEESRNQVSSTIKDIENLVNTKMADSRNKFSMVAEVISKLNPLEILKKGYAVAGANGKKLSTVESVQIGDDLLVEVEDGLIESKITKVTKVKRD